MRLRRIITLRPSKHSEQLLKSGVLPNGSTPYYRQHAYKAANRFFRNGISEFSNPVFPVGFASIENLMPSPVLAHSNILCQRALKSVEI